MQLSPKSLVTILAISAVATAEAADPISLQTTTFKKVEQQFQLSIPGTAKAVGSSPNSLQFIQQRTDNNQVNHIRMQQNYEGFEVYGGYAILHAKKPANQLKAAQEVQMNGVLYSGLDTELGNPDADFVQNADLALQHFKQTYQGKEISEEKVSPIVYIDDQNQAHWAYKVSLLVQHPDKIPERPTAIIDAKDFKPFLHWDEIMTVKKPVKGTGFGGNSKTGSYLFGNGLPLLDISRDTLTKTCSMENANQKVVDMLHKKTSTNKAMKFTCEYNVGSKDETYWTGYQEDGYDQINGAYSPANDAMYAASVLKSMYHDWYGVEVLTQRGRPMQLIMRVHYGKDYDNAFWDGEQMTFGDGDNELFYPLVSLGIGAHEVSHGFTQQNSNLQYIRQSGGLNESFSDMAAKAAELYTIGKNSWTIGAEIIKEGSGLEALRYMDVPSRDGRSIDSADKFYSGINVHYSSGVFNRMFYLLATTRGWDARKAFEIMVKANMDYWVPTSTFDQAGCGIINASKDLGYSIQDVKAALAKVKVNYDRCKLLTVA